MTAPSERCAMCGHDRTEHKMKTSNGTWCVHFQPTADMSWAGLAKAMADTFCDCLAFVPPAETPTECAACGQDSDFQRRQAVKICDVESENRQLKFDLESAQSINGQLKFDLESVLSINERKDARIRVLVEKVRLATYCDFHEADGTLDCEECEEVRAALARSEGGT